VTSASPADQLLLLDLQSIDTSLAQLAHRQRTLPEHARLSGLDADLASVRDRLIAARTEASDIESEVSKAESDVAAVRARAARDQQLLDAGNPSSSREVENLVHEIASLERRQADLEDVELALLERLEETRAVFIELEAAQAALGEERETVVAQRDAQVSDIEVSRTDLQADRVVLVDRLPADLLKLYERIRDDQGGVGAAALHRRACQGCRIELSPADIGTIRDAAPDTVLRCEECRRILVRTAESGL